MFRNWLINFAICVLVSGVVTDRIARAATHAQHIRSQHKMKHLQKIGEGYYQLRGKFALKALGIPLVQLSTHMSFMLLANGNYLVVDTIPISPEALAEINQLTESGAKIEACIATHPFHTLYFASFHELFPRVPLIGTPRHKIQLPALPWLAATINESLTKYEDQGISMSIPDGAEFVAPHSRYERRWPHDVHWQAPGACSKGRLDKSH